MNPLIRYALFRKTYYILVGVFTQPGVIRDIFISILPFPLGEGRGEGASENTLILTFSQREKGLKSTSPHGNKRAFDNYREITVFFHKYVS